ncbi:VOC family protein [Exilibacterium tricleocarpae]|uniref:VOC family protein n=1 Tax=Exilibacterium tricleocarpae TaxID=2591008 RepID=A0A545TZG6_9GAMM|nr:VOC family protein [Exilibacterium tricleocarpae]TQV82583.1 VOC family protein [Exilibacterium tricleocarpae]
MTSALPKSLIFTAIFFAAAHTASADTHRASPDFTGRLSYPMYVNDVIISAGFYRDALGFEFLGYFDYEKNTYVKEWDKEKPPIYAGFSAGGQKFGLHLPVNEKQKQAVGKGRFYFEVKNLEKLRRHFEDSDHPISRYFKTGAVNFFYVIDPDGFEIAYGETADKSNIDPW